mmetsp:Transcript_55636/g.134867  ORF Transcript_55636/g.134867 Transcript_55636/m.134867 type:complete len:353 (-) Transcript_55636:29-1087(-)
MRIAGRTATTTRFGSSRGGSGGDNIIADVFQSTSLGIGGLITIFIYCCIFIWTYQISWKVRTSMYMVDEFDEREDQPSTKTRTKTTSSSSVNSNYFPDSNHTYDPLTCKDMANGHCQDEDGKAWSYRLPDGTCRHKREEHVPSDKEGAKLLESILQHPPVNSVLDFGGGVGVYMIPFRDQNNTPNNQTMNNDPSVSVEGMSSAAAVAAAAEPSTTAKKLVVVEPQPLGDCLLRGMQQDSRDWLHLPLSDLPSEEYDLTMSIEVLEHIPVEFHRHIIQALAQASKHYMVLSVAHPGQPGEGHVGPSMKTRDQWINDVQNWTDFEFDKELNELWISQLWTLLKTNAAVYRKKKR